MTVFFCIRLLKKRLADNLKIVVQLFCGLFQATMDPPENHFNKAAGKMVNQKVGWDLWICELQLGFETLTNQFSQPTFKAA